MSTHTKHTMLPFKVADNKLSVVTAHKHIIEAGHTIICHAKNNDDAEFIVKACNSHDELVKEVEKLKEQLETGANQYAKSEAINTKLVNALKYCQQQTPDNLDTEEDLREMLRGIQNVVNSALSKATKL